MTEDQDAKDSQSDSGNKALAAKSKDKKPRAQRPLTKIIIRRLPPTMTQESFLEQVSPIPEHDYFYFSKPDNSLGTTLFSRSYINFVNVEDIFLFRDKFDGYVFLDEKGVEYVAIVEYAPFQRIPKKKKKKDPKCNTIESDPIYQEFLESLNKEPETENQPKLEYSYPISDPNDKKVQTTPLLEYLAARKQDKRGRDERRRRENDKRKMRIERKTKDSSNKTQEDVSEDDTYDECVNYDYKKRYWHGERRVYHKSKMYSCTKNDMKSTHSGSENVLGNNSSWDNHFPALSTKMHNTFTLSSDKNCKNKQEASQKSGGDIFVKEEEIPENEVKKIKPRDWDKDRITYNKFKDEPKTDSKDGTVFESKSYREQRKGLNSVGDKKKRDSDKKDDEPTEDGDKIKKDKKDKLKESPREQKSKKYSDTRKERLKQAEAKYDKPTKPDIKFTKTNNHDEIKPFTQLPQVKTDDLTKMIEEMDRKVKLEELNKGSEEKQVFSKARRNSLESGEMGKKEESQLKRQKSLDDRSKSTDREGSEDRDKSDSTGTRAERRIRNKDRPSLVIYQPGMGRFSKQRIKESDKKDT